MCILNSYFLILNFKNNDLTKKEKTYIQEKTET